MLSYYYQADIDSFLHSSTEAVIGQITISNTFDSTYNQNKSWEIQIPLLQEALRGHRGTIFFEFSVPRMGKRIDVLVIIEDVVFVIEFKVGEHLYHRHDMEQVWDYALDLKNFHGPSHHAILAPVLVATEASQSFIELATPYHQDQVLLPIKTNAADLRTVIVNTLTFFHEGKSINGSQYARGSYSPTPTIIEAALALYRNHTVEAITRRDADDINLTQTTTEIAHIISRAQTDKKKIICFVTGVPGAGKTLVGLNVATTHLEERTEQASVYLSGNGPLVSVLQEALARDKVKQEKERGHKLTKAQAKTSVKAFIQNIHHYRDAYLVDPKPPYDHVAIFDEAQRTWNKEQTVKFMRQKKGQHHFDYSEPEFLISCLDRHRDWAVIVCLVGGGQEINTGEAGISAWLEAIQQLFTSWEVYISPQMTDSEYAATEAIRSLQAVTQVHLQPNLHLSVSMRSFRAENVSLFVKQLLDRDMAGATKTYQQIESKYPIVLTRDLQEAKRWLRKKARGSERYGMVVSSQAERLKPYAIDVKSPMNPIHWFLNDKDDVRSSFYLEDVATEFHVQGLELDWTCVAWDGDLRYKTNGWETYSFKGNKWQHIHKPDRKRFLINAYRVLLTRARQGMVIVVPEGDAEDHTRRSAYYDETYEYLERVGMRKL
jgi:hypothetical protein